MQAYRRRCSESLTEFVAEVRRVGKARGVRGGSEIVASNDLA